LIDIENIEQIGHEYDDRKQEANDRKKQVSRSNPVVVAIVISADIKVVVE
jgi:hypothetical protein